MNNIFTAAQAREAAEKKTWINFCDNINHVIIEAFAMGYYEVYFVPDYAGLMMLDRMIRWLGELGYSTREIVSNDLKSLHICWQHPEPMDEDTHPRTEYLTPLRATDAKKYSDEHYNYKSELKLDYILDRVRELANVGLYTHTFPFGFPFEYDVIRPSTVDKLKELGYDVQIRTSSKFGFRQTGMNKLEVSWRYRHMNANSQNEMHGEHLLTAWNACFIADKHNTEIAAQLYKILDTIRDKSVNDGLFEYTTQGSLCSKVCSRLAELGYKVTKLGAPEYRVKISWGEI